MTTCGGRERQASGELRKKEKEGADPAGCLTTLRRV